MRVVVSTFICLWLLAGSASLFAADLAVCLSFAKCSQSTKANHPNCRCWWPPPEVACPPWWKCNGTPETNDSDCKCWERY